MSFSSVQWIDTDAKKKKQCKMGEETIVVARWDYKANQDEELDIKKNERLILLDDSKAWWNVKNQDGQHGYVPSNYVEKMKKGKGTGIFDKFDKLLKKSKHEKKGSDPKVHLDMDPSPEARAESRQQESESDVVLCFACVKFGYEARRPDELELVKGEQVAVMEKSSDGWWRGESNGHMGWFPSNYVTDNASDVIQPNVVEKPSGVSQKMELRNKEPNVNMPSDFLYGVEAIYTFQARNDEELPFEAGEHLDIIGKPENDPDWWKARNSRGHVGLVPKTYIHPLTDSKPVYLGASNEAPSSSAMKVNLTIEKTGPYANKAWFAGRITRDQAETMLSEHAVDGDFLIRESETNPGDFSVSLKAPNNVKHFRVMAGNDGRYTIGKQKFDTLDDLVEHYSRSPIWSSDKAKAPDSATKLYLKRPYSLVLNGESH
ncbi:cytoplasmic protein NCK2-like isoform X2 [Ptychodera flava]|uniref:cytoplasmic protein NCK2-like isoform X2 n=1 Tax=Ptychodera flava TaxID=63121 RepID=UPI003969ED36